MFSSKGRLFITGLFLFLLLTGSFVFAADQKETVPSQEINKINKINKIKVLVVTGGHPYDNKAWLKFLRRFPELDLEFAVLPKDRDKLAPGLEKKIDVLLLYDQDNTPLTPQQKKNFIDLLQRGIGLFALHHHLSAHQNWDEHYDLIGGRDFWQKDRNLFRGKEYPRSTFIDDQKIDIQIADPNHPITKDVKPFVIMDEAYGKCPVHPKTHVILASKFPKATPQVAWTWQYGKSPVFVNMLGHGPSAWEQPEFAKIFIQAIHWLKANRPLPTDPKITNLSAKAKNSTPASPTTSASPVTPASSAPSVTSAVAPITQPGIILSFDDCGNISGWVKILPLFKKYDVKATFFINAANRLTPTEKAGLKTIMAAGHAIGSHGVNHADSVKYIDKQGSAAFVAHEIAPADQALRALGVKPVSLAWPNGYWNEATNLAISPYYRHARGAKRYFPETGSMADEDRFFMPINKTRDQITFPGHGLDNITQKELDLHIFPSLQRAKNRGEILTIYAHAILPSGKGLSVRPEILEKIFIRAQELGLVFYRFDDIP